MSRGKRIPYPIVHDETVPNMGQNGTHTDQIIWIVTVIMIPKPPTCELPYTHIGAQQ